MGTNTLEICVLDEIGADYLEICGDNPNCSDCYIKKIIEIIFPE